MHQDHESTPFNETYPVPGVLWRAVVFLSLLMLLLYIGINWPG